MFVSNQNRGSSSPYDRYTMNPYAFRQYQHSVQAPRVFPQHMKDKTHIANLLQNPNIGKGLNSFQKGLGNLQQVLRLIETTTPFIQEYGPMIKNLPAMYRMMKALKNIDQLSDESNEESENKTDNKKAGDIEEITSLKDPPDYKYELENTAYKAGKSVPKLYI